MLLKETLVDILKSRSRYFWTFPVILILELSGLLADRGDSMTFLPMADTIIINGKILDLNNGQKTLTSSATALAIKDGQIILMGSNESVLNRKSDHTQIVDAKNRLILPGLIESHAHMLSYGLSLLKLELNELKSKSEVIKLVQKKASTLDKGVWIVGRGWDQNLWPEAVFPGAKDLDEVSLDHPVVLTRVDGHAAWANSKALQLAGIDKNTKDPVGGRILKDDQGSPTGILIDNAADVLYRLIPKVDKKTAHDALKKALAEAASFGLTMITEAGLDRDGILVYEDLMKQGELNIRAYIMVSGEEPSLMQEYFKSGPLNHDDFLMIRSVKLLADGALGSRGAALIKDYSDDAGNAGIMILNKKQIVDTSTLALASGFQVATHAIGDLANREVLDAYEEVLKSQKNSDHRFRVEHAQLIDESDIGRFGKMNVIASMQAVHCTSDNPWAHKRLGHKRLEATGYVWRKLLDSNAIVAGGSDVPIESMNPFYGIFSFVTRKDHSLQPPSGFQPENRISLAQALKAYTFDGAYAAFLEQRTGSIETGKLADLVIMEDDLLVMPQDQLFKA